MSKLFHKLSSGNFFQNWSLIGQLNTTDNWDNVASIMGFRGDGLTGSTGTNPGTITADGTAVIDVNVNQLNPNTNNTGGVTEFEIADPVVALQGSGTARAPSLVIYLDASGRQNLRFAVDLRDIDGSGDNAIQQIAIQYRIGDSGAWINLPAGYVADASTGGTATQVTHLDVTLPSAANNQSQVEIRIITTDAAGNDEWIGIDNISVVSDAMDADTLAPTIAGSNPADGAVGIPVGANLTVNFSELISLGSGDITISDGNGDTRVISVSDASQVSISGQSLIINPTDNLKLGTDYSISIGAGAVKDVAGNSFAGSTAGQLDFRTIDPLTRIFDIQGAGHTSPLAGKLVNTRGVVTAIDTTGTRGFYIQDPEGDGNSATSDAVFVFSSSSLATVKIGDMVEFTALVEEYKGSNANNLPITELTNVTGLTVLSSGHTIAPTVLGLGGRLVPTEIVDNDGLTSYNPEEDAIDFYESLEGMMVTAKDVLALTTTYQNATYVITDNGATATGVNDRGGVTSTATDPNPERFQIYNDTGINAGNTATYIPGDKLGDVTGIMTYFGGNWELIPTKTPNAAVSTTISREVTTLEGGAAHLTVGSYNLENLDPFDLPSKIAKLASDIANNIGSPDILGVLEIQDSNGTGKGVLDAELTFKVLTDAIVAAGGPQYAWVVIDPTTENTNGGEPNGNIRTAILYNPERVDYIEGSARLLEDISPANGDSFRNSRKPLVGDFMFHGEKVTFIGAHNYARLGSDALFGANQPAEISGDDRRIDQTSAIRDAVQKMMAIDGTSNIVVAGDFNAFHWESNITNLEADGHLTNMVWSLPAWDRYSYNFEGSNQQIDQLLVSSHLAPNAQFDNVHINTNQPYGSGGTDHDAVLTRLLINTAPVAVQEIVNVLEDVSLSATAAYGVLANDTDKNGDVLAATLVTNVANGTLVLNQDGSFSYTGNANFYGTDSFSYVAKDAHGGVSAVMTVTLNVAAVNDLPVGVAESATVAEDATLLINVLANDSDVDGDALAIVLGGAKSALGASVSIVDGKVSYTADADAFDLLGAGQSAADSFTYQVSDGKGGLSAPVTVAVSVREAGDNTAAVGTNKADNFVDAAGRDTTFEGGNGNDVIDGGDGADKLFGDNGTDILLGGAGRDTLDGGNGSDILFGGAGDTIATGGNGPDAFVAFAGAHLVITDFRKEDTIFTKYSGNGSAASLDAYTSGNLPAATGLSFANVDSDGNGSLDAVQITGGALGTGSVTLVGWTVASLGQGGSWLV